MNNQKQSGAFILALMMLLNLSSCKYAGSKHTSAFDSSEALVYYNEAHIQLVREKIQDNDSYFVKNYNELLQAGNAALYYEVDPVTNKTQVPPSGDMHDYLTYAPYRWPDTTKVDGLPWMAIDGIINPVSRGDDTDFNRKNTFFETIKTLTWTYYFSQDNKYAEKAIDLLRVWYLDPETKVNPNLNFAQGVPGIADGRKAGVHEFKPQVDVITALQMFDEEGILPLDVKRGMDAWFAEYLNWLTTDSMAISAGFTRQNHANYYNHQVVGIMMYLGKNEEAKAVVEDAKQSRIADQILPNGEQPREMGRTKSVSYASENLWLLTDLVLMGQKLGVDLWAYETVDGRSMKQAYDYLVPFVSGKEKWPQRQITTGGAQQAIKEQMYPLFSKASSALGVKFLDDELEIYLRLSPLEALIYPPFEMLPELQ